MTALPAILTRLGPRLQSRAAQLARRLRPGSAQQPPSAEALARSERQAATTALLASQIPTWHEKEGQDWVARNYYRIYLAFESEVSPGVDLHALLAAPACAPFSEDNQALVRAYQQLIEALKTEARQPVQQRMDELQAKGMRRVNQVSAGLAAVVLLPLLGMSVGLWRAAGLPVFVKVFLCLLLWSGALVGAWQLWHRRGRFNPNHHAMADLQARYDELESVSLERIREHACDAAVELRYAVLSGKSWVFGRLSNKWATEKYVFLGDAYYEAGCIAEVTDTLKAQALVLAQGLPVVAKPIDKLLDFSVPQLGLSTQCPRCRTSFEKGDHFCMACGLRLSLQTRPQALLS